MEHDINALTQERTALIETNEWNDESEARLIHLEFLMNQHHKRNKVFFRNGMDYTESSPAMVGYNIRDILKDSGMACIFFNSHIEINPEIIMGIFPCDDYDYTNVEHQKMMLEKYVVTLQIRNRSKITSDDYDVSAELRFSYYEHGIQRDMSIDIYVRNDCGKWNHRSNGVNWSAMGTQEPHICGIYASMLQMGVDIHHSIHSQCRQIMASLPKPLDNSGQV